jgi:formylglycine-generating enzyme required for sulfatase activity
MGGASGAGWRMIGGMARATFGRGVVAVWLGCGASGCVGEPPPLPEVLGGVTEGEGVTTAGEGVTAMSGEVSTNGEVSMSGELSMTGPVAECGNREVEADEACDGTDWQGATCGSLGYTKGILACVGCVFDVSECGPPPGMVLVTGGEFTMGSDVASNEQPIRQVNVDAFWIDETEVTVEEYTECIMAGVCDVPPVGGHYNYEVVGRENHPINGINWFDAMTYCAWVDDGVKRLPTEAEWEKAARGTDARTYPWGESPAPSCSHVVMSEGGSGCGMDSTWEVGLKPLGISPYGAMDMAGNVREWVSDWYGASYDPRDTDNPTGPMDGGIRVLRGGSWNSYSTNYFRAAYRGSNDPTGDFSNVGFRCARTPPVSQ